MPPRMIMIERVLEAALDAGDTMVVNACWRLKWADVLGWKRHHDPADMKLVRAFDDMIMESRELAVA